MCALNFANARGKLDKPVKSMDTVFYIINSKGEEK